MDIFECENCQSTRETQIVERKETIPVKGDKIEVRTSVRVCSVCDKDVYDRGLDNATLIKAYDLYRRNHNLLSPGEIVSLRETYGLSQRSLSGLLGWGEVTISRYELGSLPDEAHNQLLCFLQNPWNMRDLLLKQGYRLNDAARRKLTERLESLIEAQTSAKIVSMVAVKHSTPSALTGFLPFSPNVLKEMIVYFCLQGGGVFKTKLNKLLWYADFEHFRRHTVSISGATYVHLQYGPVVTDYEIHLAGLFEEGILTQNEVFFENGNGAEQLIACREPDLSLLSPTAIEVLATISEKFAAMTSKMISDYSHQEDAYLKTKMSEPIPYLYAATLKAVSLQVTSG